MIFILQYFITDSVSSLTFVIDDSFSRKWNPYYKLLDKNLSQLRYEETVTRVCFGPLSCPSTLQFLAIHVTRAEFVVLSMAFFTFILYKPELLQIGTILHVIDVVVKFLYFCEFWEIGGPQEVPFYLYSVAKFVIIFLGYLLELLFFLSNAKFSFAIFAKLVYCWRAFFNFVLLRYERLQNLLFLLLIPCLLKFFFTIAMKILVT